VLQMLVTSRLVSDTALCVDVAGTGVAPDGVRTRRFAGMSTVSDDSDNFLETHLPGTSPAMQQLRAQILKLNRWHRLATGRVHCALITGETGTGKGRLAKLVVQHSAWDAQSRDGNDVPSAAALGTATANLAAVLLTAVPDQLAESELFGHV